MKRDFVQFRQEVVEALWAAEGCRIQMCTAMSCGHIALEHKFDQLGLTYDEDGMRPIFTEHAREHIVDHDQDTVLMMLTDMMYWSSFTNEESILVGMMEVPESVGNLLYKDGWDSRLRESDEGSPWVREAMRKEFTYELVKLAFPDKFLRSIGGKGKFGRKNKENKAAAESFANLLKEHYYVAPLFTTEMINEFVSGTYGTSHFDIGGPGFSGQHWFSTAGYSLEMGMKEASLQKYWEGFPSIPDAFVYDERDNGYGAGMGFVARTGGGFVSQQVWSHGSVDKWNECTRAFNSYMYPVLERGDSNSAVMVVFSDYRGDAYILSSEPATWDEFAPINPPLGPIPDGFGFVGLWGGSEEDRYRPRPLSEIINGNYSDSVKAAAQYLEVCLKVCGKAG